MGGDGTARPPVSRPLWEEVEPAPVPGPQRDAGESEAPVIDRPGVELGLGALGLALALSVFLPWYHNNGPGTISGWASGTWGPIIFFLAILAVVIVGFRRAGVAVSFPVEPTLVIEGIGWVAVIGLILKRYFSPKLFNVAFPTDGLLFVSLLLAVALAVLAGVASSSAPFLVRPGWIRERSGVIGAALLVIALALGISFGMTNEAVSIPTAPRAQPAPTVTGMPSCARRLALPVPAGVTPIAGIDSKNGANCFVTFRTDLSLATAATRYTTILQQNDLKVVAGNKTVASRTLGFRGRICGTVQLIKVGKNPVSIAVILLSCVAPVPS